MERLDLWRTIVYRWGAVGLMMLCAVGYVRAESEEDEETGRNRFGFVAALTSVDTWQLETGYHYMLNRYLGVGGEFGMWKQYYYDGLPGGSNWELDGDDEYLSNLYLRPSVVLMSPTLFKIKDAQFGIVAEPGIMLNVPYQCVGIYIYENCRRSDYKSRSSSKGQWFAVDCRVGLDVRVGRLDITAGYMISDFDIYGIARNIEFDGKKFGEFYPKKKLLQGAYLSLTCII